jgi:type II secretion system protein C
MQTFLVARKSSFSLNSLYASLGQSWVISLISLLFITLLSWQSARLFWLVLTPMQSLPVVTASQAPASSMSYQWRHLFPASSYVGVSASHDVFADASVVNGWQLLGVVVDASIKLALVQQGSGGALIWMKEQQLTAQGVKVERIEPQQVMLLTRQGTRTLNLSKAASAANTAVSTTTSSAVNLSELRAQAKQNPTNAMQWLNLQPQFDNGRLVSVLVQPKAGQEAIFKQLGFMAGDQLVALNGQPMSEWMTKLASLPSLLDGAGASVKVLRAGKEQEWSLTW